MTTDSQGVDPYAAVLADLRAQREKIDAAIQTIESLRGSAGVAAPTPSPASPPSSPGDAVEGPGAFLGMSIPEAARKLLAARRKPLTNSDMLAAFKAGGLHLNSADPMNTVGSVLMRRFNVNGDIVRVGRGVWGLAEWYPGRSFKKKAAKEAEESGKEGLEDVLS